MLGILVATLANHAFAAAVGTWLTTLMGPHTLRWVPVPSSRWRWDADPRLFDEDEAKLPRLGVFGATLVAFFPAGDGRQDADRHGGAGGAVPGPIAVVAGTTLGMMIANVPAVLLGDRIATRMPVKLVHGIAAAIFLGLGIATLAGAGEGLGF